MVLPASPLERYVIWQKKKNKTSQSWKLIPKCEKKIVLFVSLKSGIKGVRSSLSRRDPKLKKPHTKVQKSDGFCFDSDISGKANSD